MAAELALGVLEGDERAEAMRHSLSNPAFAAMVRTWQDRLDPLGEGFAEAPPPNLWPAIEGRETAPAGAHRDMFIRDGQPDPSASQFGPLASGVPGQVAALANLSLARRRVAAAA